MVIRSPVVAEFLSFIDANPFCENRDVVNHFAQDEVANRVWGKPFRHRSYLASEWNGSRQAYEMRTKTKTPHTQVYNKISYLLYKWNNHLVVGGGKLLGMACVEELRRDDGRMGYILTPVGMASIADWRQKQEAIAGFEVRVSEAREEIRKRVGV